MVDKLIPLVFRSRGNGSTRRQGPITAIEVDGQTLRLVPTASRGGRTVIAQLASETLDVAEPARQNPESLGAAIRTALSRSRIKPGAVAMMVPRSFVILRTVLVPFSHDVRELASLVRFQIGKDLPFAVDDAVIDFKIVRQVEAIAREAVEEKPNSTGAGKGPSALGGGKLEVLVATVKRDVVEFYKRTASAAGLKLAMLGWSSYANARCLEACRVAANDEVVALVSLRPDEVGVDIVARDVLLFSRGANLKLAASETEPADSRKAGTHEALPHSSAPSFSEAVTIEVVRSLHAYGGMERQGGVAKLVVAGGTGFESNVAEALRKRLAIPCELIDLGALLDVTANDSERTSCYVSAIGLALGANDPGGLPVDFLNPKRPAVHRDTRRLKIIAAAAAAAVLLFALLGVRAARINARLKIQRQVQAELTDAEKKRPIYRQMRQQASTVQEWLKDERDNLQHYAHLSSILPGSEEVYATSLSMSGHGGIRLTVQARSSEVLAKLDKDLRAAGYDLKPMAITPGTDKYGYNFRTTVELIAPAKMKLELARLVTPTRPNDDASLDNPARTNAKERAR